MAEINEDNQFKSPKYLDDNLVLITMICEFATYYELGEHPLESVNQIGLVDKIKIEYSKQIEQGFEVNVKYGFVYCQN